jgi:hypothetical protein
VAPLGRRAYNALAASRAREEPCTDETCALPAAPASKEQDAGTRADAAGRPRR